MYFDQFHNASKWKKITTPSSTFGSDNHHTDDEKLILNITNFQANTHAAPSLHVYFSRYVHRAELFSKHFKYLIDGVNTLE